MLGRHNCMYINKTTKLWSILRLGYSYENLVWFTLWSLKVKGYSEFLGISAYFTFTFYCMGSKRENLFLTMMILTKAANVHTYCLPFDTEILQEYHLSHNVYLRFYDFANVWVYAHLFEQSFQMQFCGIRILTVLPAHL